jgi:hypothetical protein
MIYNGVGHLLSLGLCQGYIFQLIDEMKVGALGLARQSLGTEEVRRDASLTFVSTYNEGQVKCELTG